MNLSDLLKKIAGTRILVIGDLMLDHYIWGDVHRISPEAPVPVIHAARDTWTAGGAANVALNLANLGVQTSVLGHLADDEAGHRLAGILAERHVRLIRPPVPGGTATIIKTRVLARSQQLCRIDREGAREAYRLDHTPGFAAQLEQALAGTHAVILSDYAKGVVTQPLVDRLLAAAATTVTSAAPGAVSPGLLVAVDPKPSRRLLIPRAGLLTPNRSEALDLAGLPEPHPGEAYPLEEVCRRIHDAYHPHLLVITLGAGGMALCREGQVTERLPTEAREVFDVSGAGDTVIATLTAALAAGSDDSAAARLANAAAGTVVAHMGTVPVQYAELQARL